MTRIAPVLLLALVAGCEPEPEDDTSAQTSTTGVLASQLRFARAVDGVSEGYDLDGQVGGGCGVTDYTSPEGTPGVDNTFAPLLDVIEDIGGQALEELVEQTIERGELLIMLRVEGYDEAEAGDCLKGELLRASGTPIIGGHGDILPGQTFDRDLDGPYSPLECVKKHGDGSLTFEGFTLDLPMQVFDEKLDFNLLDGIARFEPVEGGGFRGVLGGGLDVADVDENILSIDAVPSDLINTVRGLLDFRADLAPDETGQCQRMSVVVTMDGISAFLFDDEAGADTAAADTAE